MKAIAAIRKFFFAIKVMVCALTDPIVKVAKKVHKGEPVSVGLLGFATWRAVIWLSFLLCVSGSLGVPAIVAYLFLADLFIVGIQTVYFAIAPTERKLA